MSKLQKRLNQLKKKILEYNHDYHVWDQPQVSDYKYDQLFSELLEIEEMHPEWVTKDSPSQRVGGKILDFFKKGEHRQPMLSLQNSFSPKDIQAFDERLKRALGSDSPVIYICEPKLDGLAIELIYEEGHLVGALTRGDGHIGEEVISNVKTINAIPLKLKTRSSPPRLLEIRGEILMSKSDFERLNKSQKEAEQNIFANPRNAAAGTVRQLDPNIAASRPLRMFSHSFGEQIDQPFTTQEEFFEYIEGLGLPTLFKAKYKKKPLIKLCQTVNEIIDHYHFIESIRSHLDYEIDGLVIKVNSLDLQRSLGSISRHPRWASAAKFKPEQGQTVVEDIVVQVGRTGAITPVAIMVPVKVGGVTITHATLHNPGEVKKKDVRVGDTVIVQRAGDVIPEIVSVIKKKRKKGARVFQLPTKCPSCEQPLKHQEDEVILRCENPHCPAVVKESLKHFVSKRTMNIEGMGDKLIEQLVDNHLIRTFSDIYRMKVDDIIKLERQGQKSVDNLIESINKSRQPKFERFIYALGLRFVGEETSRSLSRHFKDMESLISATEEELLSINDIGPKVASSLRNCFSRSQYIKEIRKILASGVEIQYEEDTHRTQKLKGLNIVITGTLPMSRDEIKDLILRHGGKTSSSVSKKNTDYLLAGEAAGSKLEKAQKLEVKILNWEDFQKLLGYKL